MFIKTTYYTASFGLTHNGSEKNKNARRLASVLFLLAILGIEGCVSNKHAIIMAEQCAGEFDATVDGKKIYNIWNGSLNIEPGPHVVTVLGNSLPFQAKAGHNYHLSQDASSCYIIIERISNSILTERTDNEKIVAHLPTQVRNVFLTELDIGPITPTAQQMRRESINRLREDMQLDEVAGILGKADARAIMAHVSSSENYHIKSLSIETDIYRLLFEIGKLKSWSLKN